MVRAPLSSRAALLIEPFGIETIAADVEERKVRGLLIEPFGIETA